MKEDGTVVLRPDTIDVRDLKDMLQGQGVKALSIEEMNAIIRRRGAGGA